jgi:hypothetical protein
LEYSHSFDFNDHPFVRHVENPTPYELSRLGLKKITKLKNLHYASYQSRLNSFETFPNTYMRREMLADAGFYYNGRNDMAICHHCEIGIENWSSAEDPWNRHAISSPSCCYLLTV